MKQVPLFINGEWVISKSTRLIDVTNPATQEVIAQVPCATMDEMQKAISSAKETFKVWKDKPIMERARVMMRYAVLLKEHQEELAGIICEELGKTHEDAMGDVWRGIEVVEHAANIPSMMMGETVENVATSIDTYSYTQPLGVCVGITPFNFPAMIPLWMFPLSIACGNTFILKPSEQDPLCPTRLAELFEQAGAPKGVLQVVHGDKEQVDVLLHDEAVKAISFVGSVSVGQYIYKTATDNMKRVQSFLGAKNHMVVMPDANKAAVINNIVGASVGAAGQRCMAISVAVFVGSAKEWIPEIKEKLASVRPGHYTDPEAAYGPQITPAAKNRIEGLIETGKKEGANCVLDGSNFKVTNFPDGNWIGPTMFTDVTTDMEIYKQEIFGPVFLTMNVDTLDDAINLINSNQYGNGTSIFTSSGFAARKYQHEIEVGQVGINIPIPVPLPFFSFTGWKGSFAGDQHAYGKQAIKFYTETKTITARWYEDSSDKNNADESANAGPNMSISLK